jgi:hypothetical protein
MADTLTSIASLPTDVDPDRLRRMLALSGNTPNTGAAPQLTPILPTNDAAQQKINQGASPSSFGLARTNGGLKGVEPEVPRLNRIGASDSLPTSDATQLQPIGSGSRFPAIDDQTRAAVQQRNGIPTSASTDIPNVLTPPNLQPIARPELLDAPRRSLEGFKSRMAEPVNESLNTTAGGPIILDQPGSAGFDADRLARIEDQKANPRGSAENHPGFAGKLEHIGARIGNIAGDIVAPGPMSLIPGTQLHRDIEEQGLRRNFETAQTREDRESAENARERETEEQRGIESRRNEILDRRNDILEGKQPHEGLNQKAVDDLMKQPNPATGKPFTEYEARLKLAQDLQDTKPERATHTSPFEAYAYGSPEEKQSAKDFLALEKNLGAKYQKPDEVERRYALFKKDPDAYKAMYGDRGQANEDRQTNADRTHATAMLRFFQRQRDEVSKNFMLGEDEKTEKLRELDELEKPFMETAQGKGGGGGGGKNDRVNVIRADGTHGTIPRSQLDKAKKKGYREVQ